MTAPSPFAHSPARRHANVAAVARRSKPPFYRMIVMNRLSTENVFEDLDGLAEVEIARGLQLVWGSFSLWRSGRFSLEILHSYDCLCISVTIVVVRVAGCRCTGRTARARSAECGSTTSESSIRSATVCSSERPARLLRSVCIDWPPSDAHICPVFQVRAEL